MYYYDKQGSPIDAITWARLTSDRAYAQIARTTVSSATDPHKSFDVSTVWMGMDHGFGDGTRLLFETMVFVTGDLDDLDCRRYTTEAEARTGHADTVTVVAATLNDAVIEQQ